MRVSPIPDQFMLNASHVRRSSLSIKSRFRQLDHNQGKLTRGSRSVFPATTITSSKADCAKQESYIDPFQADSKQKTEVLGLIAKVLGFDEEERFKTGLDGPGYGLRYLRNMMPARNAQAVDVSIAEAFVKFLEMESTPKTPIRLPAEEMAEETTRRSRQSSVSSSTPSQDVSEPAQSFGKSGSPNPLVMAANSGSGVMPSLPTFSVNRSSSSILRSVLQEEENS